MFCVCVCFVLIIDTDSYAKKAHNVLIKTRGKGFTKAKNKQKRKTFHGGGRIDIFASNSIVYE